MTHHKTEDWYVKTSTQGNFTFEGIAYEVIKKKQVIHFMEHGRIKPVQQVLNEVLREYYDLRESGQL